MKQSKKSNRKLFNSIIIFAFVVLGGYALKKVTEDYGFVNKRQDLEGPYEVIHVSDGDTILVQRVSEKVRVRLLGIDTPESVANENYKPNTEHGEIAHEYTRQLLDGQYVYLEYDEYQYDRYGRELAYVYLDGDGTDMVEIRILKDGMGQLLLWGSNTKYEDELTDAEAYARKNNIGFWNHGIFYE